jgi:type IV secretion system protein VirB6
MGPLFILCLLFDQTKQLFQRWLFYGIGTMFSMAVLAAMVCIALDMVIRVSVAFWTTALVNKYLLWGASSDGMTSQAMQQSGMGLILTTLILTAPPMAAMFFQGTLGGFMAYSQIGGSAAAQPGPQGQPPGSYVPAAPERSAATNNSADQSVSTGAGRLTIPQGNSESTVQTGLRASRRDE